MMITGYLKNKYGLSSDAMIETSAIADELLIDVDDGKALARDTLNWVQRRQRMRFDDFCSVIELNI